MSSWTYALTNKGRQLQAKAQTGIKLEYTRMAVGSGTLAGQSLAAMTALITPVKNLPIVRLKHPEGSTRAVVGATLTNADVTTGFYLREIGIYAMDPDDGEILYMYANAGSTADYIAPSGDGVIQKAINMNVIVGTATNVTAIINESLVYVTRDEFEEALANIDVDVSDASLTEKGIVQLTNAIDSISEKLAPTAKAVKTAYDRGSAGVTAAAAAQTRADSAFTEATAAKQLGVEQKNNVVAALNSIGIAASTSETWAQLISKITAVIRATGNATAAQVLSGATFSSASANGLTGTMPNRGAGPVVSPGATQQSLAAGYYSSPITINPGAVSVAGDSQLDYYSTTTNSFAYGGMRLRYGVTCLVGGTYRYYFRLNSGYTGKFARAQIYVNGTPRGILRSSTTTTAVAYTEDITINPGDEIQLWIEGETTDTYVFIGDMRLSGVPFFTRRLV